MSKPKNWIKLAIKKKGALTELAQKENGIDKKTGKIKLVWLKKKLKDNDPVVVKRARLALTFRGMN